MKNLILIIFVFLGFHAHSQRAYYGYPTHDTLKKGDIVIVNIPEFDFNGPRFNKLEDFDKLINLLEINKNRTFQVEINLFFGHVSEKISQRLSENLKKILEYRTTLKNYSIISNGNTKPLFLGLEDNFNENFKKNSRIEIHIE